MSQQSSKERSVGMSTMSTDSVAAYSASLLSCLELVKDSPALVDTCKGPADFSLVNELVRLTVE